MGGRILIGEQLGPYAIQSELGSGGMGKVYLAHNGPRGLPASLSAVARSAKAGAPQERRRVALKILHPHLLESAEALERFRREAEIGRRVRHDNVVRTLDVGSAVVTGSTHHYVVMEYVEGQTLRGLLGELGRVPEELCRHIGREIAKGLEAIHDVGVVHRDLKPENVLITREHVVKVMDLGVAWLQDAAFKLSQTGAFLGSVLYAAPEQFHGEAPDSRADFYSLGLVLYELATGRHPFQADAFAGVLHRQLQEAPRPVAELNPQLSPFFEEVCKALLEKDRGKRMGFLPADEESEWWKARARAIRRETKRPLRRIRIPRETALYGRDDELARLEALYERVKAGDGRVLLLEGEAGIGKTRLLDEFVGRLQEDGEDLNFLFGSYPSGGAATAAGAFTTAYGEHFGHEGLNETLKRYLTSTPVLIPAFAALLRGEPTPKGEEALTKDSLQTVFSHATRGLAAERPTVVLVDDLHFSPEEGQALFTTLAMAVPGHRILLVGTMRPGVQEDWIASTTRLEHCEQLALARLGPKDLVRLIEESFQSERLAEKLGTKIAVKSDGNPFFVFEIIRGLREGRFITQTVDGSWATTQEIDDIQIPSSVMDLIRARTADLDEDERDLLDVASCCGLEFDPGLVGAAAGLGQIPALKRFGQIERKHRLIRSAGRHYVFDHHQIREALYTGLHDQLKEPYHVALAEALEQRADARDREPADLDGALSAELASHFLDGARGDKALRYLDPALEHLERCFLNEAAIRLADRALQAKDLLDGEERLRTLLRKASRHALRGEREAGRAALDEALDLADASGEPALRAKVRTRLGRHFESISDFESSLQMLEEAVDFALQAQDEQLEGNARVALGLVSLYRGQVDEARVHFEELLARARTVGNRRREASVTGNLMLVLRELGRIEEALRVGAESLALFQELEDRHGEARAAGNLGGVLERLGRADEARAHSHRCLALMRGIGDRRGEAIETVNLGSSLARLGRTEEALARFEQSLVLMREIGDRRGEAHVTGWVGIVFGRLGRIDEARDLMKRHLSAARQIGDRRGEGRALMDLATLLEGQGDLAGARRSCMDCLPLRRELGAKAAVAETLVVLGRLDAACGDTESAATRVDEALALARETKSPGTILAATVEQARLPGGDVNVALAALQEHAERVGSGRMVEARFRLWELTQDKAHLTEAHRLLGCARDHAPEDCRDSMIENVPLHKDIMEAWKEHGEKQ